MTATENPYINERERRKKEQRASANGSEDEPSSWQRVDLTDAVAGGRRSCRRSANGPMASTCSTPAGSTGPGRARSAQVVGRTAHRCPGAAH